MRVAITGGTGFVGRHLARDFVSREHEVVLIGRGKDLRDESIYKLAGASFFTSDLSDVQEVRRAFSGCQLVAHCAGINREIGAQTYQRVHVAGTQNKTLSITGPEEIMLSEAVRRVGQVIGRNPLYLPTPLVIQKVIAWVAERTMKIPLLSLAQLRILSEGITEALPPCDSLPADLLPTTRFIAEQIQKGLPEPGPFGLHDLRCCNT